MAENEELDVVKNRRWKRFVNILRGAPSLNNDRVLQEFDRCFVQSLRRVCRILKVENLIKACIAGDSVEIDRLRQEHRKQRDCAETFADLIELSSVKGMSYREAADSFVHAACARIFDQCGLIVPSDNFPTIEDYRESQAIWLFRMEPRINRLVDQIVKDPTRLRVERSSRNARENRIDEQLGWSLMDQKNRGSYGL